MSSVYQFLLYGSIQKNMGEGYGHRFYTALRQASVDDLERAKAALERWGRYPQTHQARRLKAIDKRLSELAIQNKETEE